MKRNTITILAVLIVSILSVGVFSSCDKDTDCKLKVNVVRKNDNRPVANARVVVAKQGSSIRAEGNTDASGIFEATFAAPAIFDVTVRYLETATVTDTVWNQSHTSYTLQQTEEVVGSHSNSTSVRLKDGEEVSATLTLDFSRFD